MSETESIEAELAEQLKSYRPSASAVELIKSTPVVLLVGVSGAGKDTIKQKLLESGEYHHIVSHTTRPPRSNAGVMERDGLEYNFIDKKRAVDMLKAGDFVEAKMYSGNIYGTSVAEIKTAHDNHKIAITDIEVQGVAEYKAISANVIAVFILPPSYQEWRFRLSKRYGDRGADPADMKKRMDTAIVELEEALSQDYYHYVVNDSLSEAVQAVNSIAHHDNEFSMIDKSFRVWAERLLGDLRAGK